MKMWTKFLVIWLALNLSLAESTFKPCRRKKLSNDADSWVCVCDTKYCDTLNVAETSGKNEFVFVSSSKDGERFNFTLGRFPRRNRVAGAPAPLDLSKTYVKIKEIASGRPIRGFGGTYTGSSAYVLSLMAVDLQRQALQSFYSPKNGANFAIARIPIGSTINDLKQWTYNEYPTNDNDLTNFTAYNREDRLRSCQIKQLKRVTKNPNIEFMAVASTAPRWMTTVAKAPTGYRSVLKPEYYQTWANYHLRYLQMMSDQSVDFSFISTGQRPDSSLNSDEFSPLAWNPYEQGKWLAANLGPTLRASKFFNISIIAYDDNRQNIPAYVSLMNVGNVGASRYIDAIGIQNYRNKVFLSSLLDLTYLTFPRKPIMNTEIGFEDAGIGSWDNAEALALDIIDNLQHDSTAYIVNNLILNNFGGPSLNRQPQDAPILVSDDSTEFYKQPIYYVLAHFSKYIVRDSVRLDTYTSKYLDVPAVAYLRPDDTIVAMMYNRLDKSVPIVLTDQYQGTIEFQLKPKSINTLIY